MRSRIVFSQTRIAVSWSRSNDMKIITHYCSSIFVLYSHGVFLIYLLFRQCQARFSGEVHNYKHTCHAIMTVCFCNNFLFEACLFTNLLLTWILSKVFFLIHRCFALSTSWAWPRTCENTNCEIANTRTPNNDITSYFRDQEVENSNGPNGTPLFWPWQQCFL
jgi:hypothetical protein